VQQPPVLQFRIQQPRQYVIEAPVFIEPPVVRFTAPVYYAPPSQTVIRQRTFTPPVYQLPTFSRTVIRCRT
jgi:hypothetical protein